MDALRKNGLLLLVVAGIALLAVLVTLALVCAAMGSDPKYIPLIGSCITAITTLLSVTIAAGGLWVAYWNLANPFRIELHKRQTDTICELIQLAQVEGEHLCTWAADRSRDTTGENWIKHVTAYRNLWAKQRDRGVLLPDAVNGACAEFLERCWELAGKINVDAERRTDLISDVNKFREEVIKLVNTCRMALHTDRLTVETARLLTHSNQPPSSPQ